MHRMVVALTKLLAPMLVFTADEAWEYIQHKPDEDCDLGSVHLALLPKASGVTVSDEQREEWKLLMELRGQAHVADRRAAAEVPEADQAAGSGSHLLESTTIASAASCRRTDRIWKTSSAPARGASPRKAPKARR